MPIKKVSAYRWTVPQIKKMTRRQDTRIFELLLIISIKEMGPKGHCTMVYLMVDKCTGSWATADKASSTTTGTYQDCCPRMFIVFRCRRSESVKAFNCDVVSLCVCNGCLVCNLAVLGAYRHQPIDAHVAKDTVK